ncbi:phenylphosphate carboxylase subunit delta [Desulfonema ishimotonii]|uniref:Phenylphosphate carboxylase subunit delta n=1 Tax=Desulfonema ishimotonii TaxID=45657 RepID=A0A401G078_9BACT|nr:HAD-IIIA family hydrolase [Desulfonema ishimotonii]GBC62629.1 phenylphosphate carboxylase subunit delta [Desulfonema ishimotonii]
MNLTPDLTEKLERTELLLLDVDGVLTDGGIIYDDDGKEIKIFNVRDGLGIRMAMDAGIGIGIVTGRSSGALRHRCRNLGIDYIFDGVKHKAAVLEKITDQTGVAPGQMAFVGDDLPDLPLMRRVGLSVAVSDAHEMVIGAAHLVTSRGGGCGAVREICDALLKARGAWERMLNRFE